MLENKDKFFLYDRWFYFKKEKDSKLTYTSMLNDQNNGLILIYDSLTNEIEIISLKDDEFMAKLHISDITQKDIRYHYKESTPQNIYIEDDLYVNLLLEAFVETKQGRIDKESIIRVSKKKNLDKIVYCTPNIPLDEDLYLEKYKIESNMLNYFLELIDSFSIYVSRLKEKKAKEKPTPSLLETKYEQPTISNLEKQETLYIYDRRYAFVDRKQSNLNYINKNDGEHRLRIRLDPNLYFLTGFSIESINEKNHKYILSALYGENDRVIATFGSEGRVPFRISYNEEINTYVVFEGTYDKNAKNIDTQLKLEKASTLIILKPHPFFSGVYTDQNGNEYRFCNQDFSRLTGIADASPNILNYIKKELTKKK